MIIVGAVRDYRIRMAEKPLSSLLEKRQASFRRLITGISSHLQLEDVINCTFLHNLPRDRIVTPLDALELLIKKGRFSHSNVDPLVQLLQDINRCDLVTDLVDPYRNDYPAMDDTGTQAGIGGSNTSMDDSTSLHTLSQSTELISSTSLQSLTVHEKREMFYHLQSDPDIQSLNISPVTSLTQLQRSYKPLTHKQTSSDSGCSGGITFSPENSLTCSQRPSPCLETSLTRPDHELTRPEHIPSQSEGACPTLSSVPEATPLPTASLTTQRQVSDDGFLKIETTYCSGTAIVQHPITPSVTPSHKKKRIEWSINRIELGRRIVEHSNKAFVKCGVLSVCGDRWSWFKRPVSLVFKVYPFGLGQDENQCLTFEVFVECRCNDLRSVAKVNLEVQLSMANNCIFNRSWQKPLKTFRIHDFLPHEIITRSYGKTLDFVILTFLAFD